MRRNRVEVNYSTLFFASEVTFQVNVQQFELLLPELHNIDYCEELYNPYSTIDNPINLNIRITIIRVTQSNSLMALHFSLEYRVPPFVL